MASSPDKTTAPHPAVLALDRLYAQADEAVQLHRSVYSALSDKGEHSAASLALASHDVAVLWRLRVSQAQKEAGA